MNKRLLFVGVSSMKEHAGQHKLYFIAQEFGRLGIPVTVLVPDLEENREFFRDDRNVEARFFKAGGPLAECGEKSRVLREGGWSAVWVVGVGIRSYVFRGWRTRAVPIIRDFDEFPSLIQSLGAMRRMYLRWIERRMIRQADAFTCASAYLEEAVRRRRPALGPRVLRLPVAISAHDHLVDHGAVAGLRARAQGIPILLYVGSVTKIYEDQLDETIALAVELQRRGVPARIRIAGTGPDMAHFKDKAVAAGAGETVEFVGHVRRQGDLPNLMEAADILIFPFAANPFNLSRCPTKAFHYAAANRPVVTNRTGEVSALFGDSALYYPEGNIAAMADCCVRALELGSTYSNGIPFDTLTWTGRAEQFKKWLLSQGWVGGTDRRPGRLDPAIAAP